MAPGSDIVISPLDYAIVALNRFVIDGIGFYAGAKSRQGKSEAGDYFLSARTLKWREIGLG